MKIGFIRSGEKANQMTGFCDAVMIGTTTTPIGEQLLTIVEDYQDHELVFYNLEDLRLQIVQLLPILTKVIEYQTTVTFVDRTLLPALNDQEFIECLIEIALQEKAILSRRTQDAVSTARQNGKVIGRPRIDTATIDEIYFLYKNQGRSIREVAALCEVSIGTVHKYVTMEKEAVK